MEVVVTTGAISRAKLQSNRQHQETNTQFFTGRMPFLSPNQQCQSTDKQESNCSHLSAEIYLLYTSRSISTAVNISTWPAPTSLCTHCQAAFTKMSIEVVQSDLDVCCPNGQNPQKPNCKWPNSAKLWGTGLFDCWPIAQFAIAINSNVCPHIRVLNTLMRESYAWRHRNTLFPEHVRQLYRMNYGYF